MNLNRKVKLVLENGTVFSGKQLGSKGETIGEVCFNTGMTGYQEILTDPSYCGQLVTMTYPHIGNYGANDYDVESNGIKASGMIVREVSDCYSNFRGKLSISDYLKKNKIVGIQGIDTRKLTQVIRDEGYMNVIISNQLSSSSMRKKLLGQHNIEGENFAKYVALQGRLKFKIYN